MGTAIVKRKDGKTLKITKKELPKTKFKDRKKTA